MNRQEIDNAIDTLLGQDLGPHDLTPENLRGFRDLNPEGPYHFVNLLKFKDKASYPDGHPNADKNLKGIAAYNIYGAVAFQQVTKRGGRLMNMNSVKFSMGVGEWDAVATMEYQSVGAFLNMLLDKDYQSALVHREAGLASTDVIITRPKLQNPLGQSS